MSFADVQAKLVIDPSFDLTSMTRVGIDQLLHSLYNKSTAFRDLLENYAGTISINYGVGQAHAIVGAGAVEIDPVVMSSWTYISKSGTAANYSFDVVLVHELGHALGGKRDTVSATDFAGDNVKFMNPIFRQLGFAEMVSYVGIDASNMSQDLGRNYTNGKTIDVAVTDRGGTINAGGYLLDTVNVDRRGATVTTRDLLLGSALDNVFYGGLGDDFLYGEGRAAAGAGGADQLYGNEGNDFLDGGAGDDTLEGGTGNDSIYGGAGADTIKGGDDNDEIWGGENPAGLSGLTDGNDVIDGGDGKDKIYGGAGNDVITGGAGNDVIWGGEKAVETNPAGETDTASYATDGKPVTIRYSGSGVTPSITVKGEASGTDTLHSIEKIVGTAGRDIVNIVGQIATGTNLTIDANGGQGANPRDTINLSKSTVGGTVTLDAAGAGTISTGANQDIHLTGFHTGLIGSDFADSITDSSSGNKEIDGGAGDDTLSIDGSDGAGFLVGGAGNDTITGGSGNDIIFGGSAKYSNYPPADESIYLYGNQLNGGDGNDRIYSESALDHINGGAGDDYISIAHGMAYALWGETVVDGGAGNDVIRIDPYQNFGFAGDATVVLRADSGHDTVLGQFGQVVVDSNPFDDPVHNSVNINLEGITFDDLKFVWNVPTITPGISYEGRGDLAIIVKSTGASILVRNAYGNNRTGVTDRFRFAGVTINHSDLMYYAGPGGSSLGWLSSGDTSAYDVAEADYAAGTALPQSSTTGTSGNDDLVGGAGDDTLSGGDGDDLFTASPGNDQVDGGNGNDTFELFGSRADFTVAQGVGGSLEIRDNRGILGNMKLTSVENVYFIGDGETYQLADLLGYYGTSGDDTLIGSSLANEMFGLGGNDVFVGGGGNDHIDGGEGTDVLKVDGANGDYALQFNHWEGAYHLSGVDEFGDTVDVTLTNVEQIQFLGDGTLLDVGSWSLSGTSGDDILSSGPSGFELQGLAGNDVLNGSGFDVVLDGGDGDDLFDPGAGNVEIIGGAGDDRVRLTGSLLDYTVSQRPDGTIEIYGIVDNVAEGRTTASNIESVYFAGDNATLLIADLPDVGTSANDTIIGSSRSDGLYGLEGDDTLIGLEGNDRLFGGAGADTMQGGAGDDYYEVDNALDVVVEASGEGRDAILSSIDFTLPDNVEDLALAWSSGALVATGNELNNVLEGNDGDNLLIGENGDDRLSGGSGNDTLDGGSGSDSYLFSAGDGQDVIANETRAAGIVNVVELGDGISQYDAFITTADTGHDIVIGFLGSDETITVDEMNADPARGIDEVHFANGAVWTYADIMARRTTFTSGNGTITGTAGNDTLMGGGGDDTIKGLAGNDVLVGGAGNDMLTGGGGDDVYRYLWGDGVDIIDEYGIGAGGSGGTDSIQFGAGILPDDVTVSQTNSGSDLVLSFAGSSDSITLRNAILSSLFRVEQVRFSDGTSWTYADLLARSMLANTGDDIFYGDENGQTLRGGTGNDRLEARAGDDVLIGGTGNDILIGDAGNDTYVFAAGDGQDVIDDFRWGNSLNTLQFGTGIAPENVLVNTDANGLHILIGFVGSTDLITLKYMNISQNGIDRIQFADGTVWSGTDIVERIGGGTGPAFTAAPENFAGSAPGEPVLDAAEPAQVAFRPTLRPVFDSPGLVVSVADLLPDRSENMVAVGRAASMLSEGMASFGATSATHMDGLSNTLREDGHFWLARHGSSVAPYAPVMFGA